MPSPTAEYGQYTTAANANASCFNGPGVCLGIFVSAASNTPTLTVQDATAPVAGNTSAVIQTFTPTVTFWPVKARVANGLQVVVGGNVSYTVLWQR